MHPDIKKWLQERKIPLNTKRGWMTAMTAQDHLDFQAFMDKIPKEYQYLVWG